MNDLGSALLAVLGTGGLAGFGALVVRAFLQALRATAEINAEKNQTIARQAAEIASKDRTIEARDGEIDRLNLDLLATRRDVGAKDIEITGLRADLRRADRGERP